MILKVSKKNNVYFVDSRDLAEYLDRPHKDVLKSIRSAVESLEELEYNTEDFFIEAEYKDEQSGKDYPCFFVTRKGCAVLVSKMFGDASLYLALTYDRAFNAVIAAEDRHPCVKNRPAKPEPSVSAEGIGELLEVVEGLMIHNENSQRIVAEEAAAILKHYGIPVVKGFVEGD